jgi:hypothetical protein
MNLPSKRREREAEHRKTRPSLVGAAIRGIPFKAEKEATSLSG